MIVYKIETGDKPSVEFTYNGDETIINIPDEDLGITGYTTVDTNELLGILALIKKEHSGIKDTSPLCKEKIECIKSLLKDYYFTVNGGMIDDDVAYDAFAANMLIMAEEWNS